MILEVSFDIGFFAGLGIALLYVAGFAFAAFLISSLFWIITSINKQDTKSIRKVSLILLLITGISLILSPVLCSIGFM